MSEKKEVGGVRGTPVSNTLLSKDINLSDAAQSMASFPEKLKGPTIQYFREKPVHLLIDGFSLYFKKIDEYEYWICEQQMGGSYHVHWIEFVDSKPRGFHRKISNRYGLDVENRRRDQVLVKHLNAKSGIESEKIKEYLNEVGVFIGDNRTLLSSNPGETENISDFKEKEDEPEEISEEKREELIEILKRPDLLSFIDKALYERSPNDGFIIGEVESKHILNFNCVGARLGLSTINTLKGASSIGKTNTADVVTSLHRTKKVGSLSDTALKYATDLGNIDILYIQETLEEEFRNKETRLMSADDGGFLAETTVKNRETGKFEIQQNVIPVKTLVTTTTAIELDPEFASRNFIIPVDDSVEQTERILEENCKTTEKILQEIKGETNFNMKYELLKEAYNVLQSYTVLIPFEMDLMDIFPTSNPRARRDSKKLMQLIKESALLFQFQRCTSEINERPVLVASWADLAHAIVLGGPIMEATLTGFDKRLMEALPVIYELIEKDEYVTSKSLHKALKKSTKYSWEILKFFDDNGYICHDSEIKRAHGIKGKVNVYVKTGIDEYKSLLLAIRNIDWIKIKSKEEDFIKEQIPNSSHKVGEEIYLPNYDPSAPNKVVYPQTSIHSEKFRIYKNKDEKEDKKPESISEFLKNENRIICQVAGAEIDYKNLNSIEKAILTELVAFKKYTVYSIIEELTSRFNKLDILATIRNMEVKGWVT